jgi:hypothetical protein
MRLTFSSRVARQPVPDWLASLDYSRLLPSARTSRSLPVQIPSRLSTQTKITALSRDFSLSGAFWTKSELSSRLIRTLILKILAVLEVNSDPRQHEPESLCDGLWLVAICPVCAQIKDGY